MFVFFLTVVILCLVLCSCRYLEICLLLAALCYLSLRSVFISVYRCLSGSVFLSVFLFTSLSSSYLSHSLWLSLYLSISLNVSCSVLDMPCPWMCARACPSAWFFVPLSFLLTFSRCLHCPFFLLSLPVSLPFPKHTLSRRMLRLSSKARGSL